MVGSPGVARSERPSDSVNLPTRQLNKSQLSSTETQAALSDDACKPNPTALWRNETQKCGTCEVLFNALYNPTPLDWLNVLRMQLCRPIMWTNVS